MNNLKILTYNNEFVGFDGDIFVNYCQDELSGELIAISNELKFVIAEENHRELFLSIFDAIELLAKSLYKEKDWQEFAKENGMEVRNIPNLSFKKNGRFRMPIIYFIEVDSVEELENGLKK